MNKVYLITVLVFLFIFGCNHANKSKTSDVKVEVLTNNDKKAPKELSDAGAKNEIADFIPSGYKIFQETYGDLNKDGIEDCVLIIKRTDRENIIKDEYRGEQDRNRRGIIILFKQKNNYIAGVKNYDCFSSENEDGGVYFAPELDVSIEKQKLYVHYGHGRYGYWSYTFRFQNNDFELIGYDSSSNSGPIVNSETSINFLTKKKVIKTNTNGNAESGEEVFKESIENIKVNKLLKLSEIVDFDEIEIE